MPSVRCKSCRESTEAQVLEAPDLLMCLECGTLSDAPDRPGLALPKGCSIEELAADDPSDSSRRGRPVLRITEPGPKGNPAVVALELFGILALFIGIATGLILGEQPGLGILTVPTAVVALVYAYITLVPNGSRAVVTMGDEALLLARTPFPWRKRYISRRFVGRLDVRACHDETEPRTYEVVAVLQSGERMVMLGGFEDPWVAVHVGRQAQQRWS